MRQLPAGPARRGDAEAVPFVEPEVPQPRRRSDDRAAIGRIGDRAVVDPLDPHLAERRHPRDGGEDIGLQPFQIVGEQLVFRIRRRPVRIADRRPDLVRPEQQPAGFLAHVIACVALAQHAHLGQPRGLARHDFGVLLGHDILVLDRDHRHVEPDHLAGLAREAARRRHDMLAGDIALVGRHQPFAIGLLGDRRHRHVAMDRRTILPRALGQRLRQIGGLDIAVGGVADRRDHAADVRERPDLLHLRGRQQVDIDADRPRDAHVIEIFVEPVLRAGKADVADVGETDVEPGLGLEARVQIHRILVHLADRIAQVEQRQQPRGMPCRSGGQFLALEEHAVAPAQLGEVIERAHTHHAATDHHHACMRLQGHVPPDEIANPCVANRPPISEIISAYRGGRIAPASTKIR